MKIAFNRQIRRTPWGGGSQFLSVFADFLAKRGHEVVHKLEPNVDAVVMLDPRHEDGGFSADQIHDYKRKNPKTKVLHRVNDTGKTRGGHELDRLIINANRKVADRTVFISEWVQRYYSDAVLATTNDQFERLNRLADWRARPSTVITNGCDADFFYPPAREREKCLSVMSRPRSLVTHHWSDNPAKGLDLYAHIDELMASGQDNSFTFTYVGRFSASYKPKSPRFKIIPPLYGHALGDELRKHDVYVTGARWEACGSHHVEAAACGLPVIFHKDGGGVVEMCERYGVGVSSPEEFSAALHAVEMDFKGYCDKAAMADLGSHSMCTKYLDVIYNMVHGMVAL